MARGEFDGLPGKGKPIDGLDSAADTVRDDDWWLKAKLRAERLSYLPPTIRIRKEVEEARAALRRLAGGALEIGTVYVTLSALSWDPADWNWKLNHDTGLVYEQLFAADLTKSKQYGGTHPFYADAWLPSDAIRGDAGQQVGREMTEDDRARLYCLVQRKLARE